MTTTTPPCWSLRRVVLGLCLLALAGCGGIGVRRADAPDLFQSWRVSAVGPEELSPRTLQTLRRWDLEALYHDNAPAAHRRLQESVESEPEPELFFALAELSFVLGRRSEKREHAVSVAYYYLAAGYSYHFLFDRRQRPPDPILAASQPPRVRDPGSSPFDPRFRVACDLYNMSLAKCLRAAQSQGHLDPRQELRIPAPEGQNYTLSVSHEGFRWKPEEFGPLFFCADFEAVGIANHHRTYGLGVPLIATRAADAPAPEHGYYPPNVSFPVTAFLRFEGSVANLRRCREARLELVNPMAQQTVAVANKPVPLETDLTTPLAYFLARNDLSSLYLTGFVPPERVLNHAGLYMLEPYTPGKIPVLMVHGILSSPLTWTTMFNDLRADPVLRERYQFWFYFYPTSTPYITTAADLRQVLAKVRKDLDPRQQDPAFDDLVLVGHSMGGLISKLLTIDSQNDFWKLVSQQPLETLNVSASTREQLQRVFYFEQQPAVKRVVFLGTPHRGSRLSPALPGRIANYFVRLPKQVLDIMQDVTIDNPQVSAGLKDKSAPTALDLLEPGSPALQLLAARPRPETVHYHSIIGLAPPSTLVVVERTLSGANRAEPGDGIVPYTSAHLDDADSEITVPAEHMQIHHHPLAVREMRRILLEHAREASSRPGVVPAFLERPEVPRE